MNSKNLKPHTADSDSEVSGFSEEAVQNRLDPGSMAQKIELIDLLVNSMPRSREEIDIAVLSRGYAYAMADVSIYRLRQVVENLISGRAGVKWLPMPNELGIMVREKMRFDIDYAARKVVEPIVYDETPPLSPEEIDQRKKQVASALKTLKQQERMIQPKTQLPMKLSRKTNHDYSDGNQNQS